VAILRRERGDRKDGGWSKEWEDDRRKLRKTLKIKHDCLLSLRA
jgi:hypothetical protein